MVSIKNLTLAALAGIAMALPEPHTGMVDNDKARDVGVVYNKPNFQGNPKFVFEIKGKPECLGFNKDMPSIQICKEDVTCVFYTGNNCNPGKDNYAVAIGCGDVAQVETPKGNHFGRYRCGKTGSMGIVNYTVPTEPHKKSEGEADVMGK